MFQTTCEKCIFSEKENGNQIGCEAGRLEKFAEQGATSYQVNEKGNGYYIISGRHCNMCRQSSWATDVKTARKEATIKFAVTVFCKGQNKQQIFDTIDSIETQDTKPTWLNIVNISDSLEIVEYLSKHYSGKWKVLKRPYQTLVKQEILDKSFKGCKCQYYVMLDAGRRIPRGFFSDIDVRVNDDLEKVFYDYNDSQDILTTQYVLYWMLPKNIISPYSYETTINNIKEVIEELKCPA